MSCGKPMDSYQDRTSEKTNDQQDIHIMLGPYSSPSANYQEHQEHRGETRGNCIATLRRDICADPRCAEPCYQTPQKVYEDVMGDLREPRVLQVKTNPWECNE